LCAVQHYSAKKQAPEGACFTCNTKGSINYW
jgi:hypothetical protein